MTRVDLLPGDHLLYRPNSFWGTLIAVKTVQWVSHVEVFVGQQDDANTSGYSVASRDGIGVNRYPLRTSGLYYVLRPNQPFDLSLALQWFDTVKGQKYDWVGLSRFVIPREIPTGNNNKMFCSEFTTRLDRAGKFNPFGRYIDADAVAPASYLYSTCFDCSEFKE